MLMKHTHIYYKITISFIFKGISRVDVPIISRGFIQLRMSRKQNANDRLTQQQFCRDRMEVKKKASIKSSNHTVFNLNRIKHFFSDER